MIPGENIASHKKQHSFYQGMIYSVEQTTKSTKSSDSNPNSHDSHMFNTRISQHPFEAKLTDDKNGSDYDRNQSKDQQQITSKVT